MILHQCDRCGSLSDDKVGLRAQNKYEEWQKITFRAVVPPDWGDELEGVMEICKTCKRSLNEWCKPPEDSV